MSNITKSIALSALGDGVYEGQTDINYRLITGPFGGWVSAIMLKAATVHLNGLSDDPKAAHPVSMTVNFIAPITAPSVRVQVIVQKMTRTLCFLRVEATQILEDKSVPVASALVILGPRRGDLHLVEQTMPPDLPLAHTIAPYGGRTGGPNFFARYEVRYVIGVPFHEGEQSRSIVYTREHPPAPIDAFALAAMSDVPLPRLMFRRPSMMPFATVTLTINFHHLESDLIAQGSDELVIESRTRQIRSGFFDQTSELWSKTGILLATSEQMVWFKD
jgi:acyl-CoA thioesterase